MKKSILVIGIIITLIGCSSVPDATSTDSTLVVGTILNKITNFETDAHDSEIEAKINGGRNRAGNAYGIEISIKSITGETSYLAKSNADGIFTFSNIPAGEYYIEYLRKKFQIDTSRYIWKFTVGYDGNADKYTFAVIQGEVNNLGHIDWTTKWGKDTENNSDFDVILVFNQKYDEAKTLFGGKYKKSNWNQREWSNIEIRK
jgi:hypothetical protein